MPDKALKKQQQADEELRRKAKMRNNKEVLEYFEKTKQTKLGE